MGKTRFTGPDAVKLLGALKRNDNETLKLLGVESLDEITELDLFALKVVELPAEIGKLSNLQSLDLSRTQITTLPAEIGKLSNLKSLYLLATQITTLPAEIGKLSDLQRLDLGRTQITAIPAEIGKLSKLQRLYLGRTQITAIPAEIGKLSDLQILDLSGTQINAIPAEICKLSNLQSLDLSRTQINAIPAEIGKLSDLKSLYLSGTQITAIHAEIGKLSDLQSLDLSGTQITALPAEICKLSDLQRLDLSRTQINAIPAEICKLSNLKSLYLSGTQITAIHAEIGKLSDLQSLDLSGTQITALPAEIGKLSNLQWLDLSGTQITAIPAEICKLSNLQWLDLSGTQITALPAETGELINLQRLDLNDTRVSDLPRSLFCLTALKQLSLDHTKVESIPDWINQLTSLRLLWLRGLALKELPKAVFDLDLPFFLSYEEYSRMRRQMHGAEEDKGVILEDTSLKTQPISLFALKREFIRAYYDENKIPIREGKVIFLGDGGAGKSHTIERILKGGRDEEICTDKTPGISIKTWEPEQGNREVKINFWDFGGQEIMHAMHRCFLTGRSLYVVVLRERSQSRHNDLNMQARYWLENIRSFAPDCPVILAVNREQYTEGGQAINTRQLRETFTGIIGNPIEYCAKEDKEDNFETLTKTILEHALKLDSTEMKFPESWNNVRIELDNMSNRRGRTGSEYYIAKSEYKQLCIDEGIKDENIQRWLLEWFNDLGVCFSYHQKDGKELVRYQVLNPEWLTNAIYAIINIGRRRDFNDNGVITRGEINSILSDPSKHAKERTVQLISYNDEEQGYVLDIMKKFNLCEEVDERNFFIPALCSPETPEHFRPGETEYADHTRFEFTYKFLPDSVIHRLMIECIRAGFKRKAAYFYGIRVDFETDDITMTAEADTVKNVLVVDIYHKNDPDSSRKKLSWVRRKIAEINSSMNLESTEQIVVCDGENRAPLPLNRLFKQRVRGKKTEDLYDEDNDELVSYDLDDVLRLLYDDSVVKSADRIMKKHNKDNKMDYRDALAIAEAEKEERKENMKNGKYKFTIGVSYAGEQEDFVRDVCTSLCIDHGLDKNELFFARWHEHLLNGANGDFKLDRIYSERCETIVVLFSNEYVKKHWTTSVEWNRAITTRITGDPQNVCLLRYGNVDIDSIDLLHGKKDIVKDVFSMTPEETAEFIMKWYSTRE